MCHAILYDRVRVRACVRARASARVCECLRARVLSRLCVSYHHTNVADHKTGYVGHPAMQKVLVTCGPRPLVVVTSS